MQILHTDKNNKACEKLAEELLELGVRVDTDIKSEPIGGKVKQAEMEKVFTAIKKLSSEHGDVIMLRFIEDISLRDTAKALKKTEGAVKLMQHRAIKELRKILGDTISKI